MDKDSVKWLVAGCAGALFCMILMGVGGALLFRYGMQELANLEDYGDEGEPSYGPDVWKEKATEHLAEEAAKEALLEASGLLERYTIVYVHDDTRNLLYYDQNFPEVENRLTAQFAAADTPLARFRYGQHIKALGDFSYEDDPEKHWPILEAWVAHSPNSHLPYLIRGNFAIDYAWYYRGNTYANRVTDEGWEGFHRYMEQAQRDLEHSLELKPDDIEAAAAMMTVASAAGLGNDVMEAYFQKTMAVNPLHRDAYMTKLNFAQPKWGGSWEDVEAVIAEAESKYAEFPLMIKVKRYGEWYMASRGKRYEGTWNSDATQRMMYASFKAQAAMNPEDLFIQADLASFAADLLQFDEAAAALDVIGDHFPQGCRFGELQNFHKWRAIIYAEHAYELGGQDTPEAEGYFQKALAIAPDVTVVAGLYMGHLARLKDDAKTQAFYESLQDPYLATGDWAAPPNYTVMEAMAQAGRSDDYGIQNTEQEAQLVAEALALAPDNPYVLLISAEYCITHDLFDEARPHLEKAREVAPDYLPALHIMGWLNFHQDRWDDGIATAQAFLAATPKDDLDTRYLETYADDAREIVELCEKKK